MSRSRAFSRRTAAGLLAGVVGIGAAGCVVVLAGGYGVTEPAVVVPAPGVVVAPGPVIYGRGYRRRDYYGGRGHHGYGHYGHGHRRWRGWGG